MVLYAFLTTLLFWGTPRFRFPVDGIIIIIAAAGMTQALGAVPALRQRMAHAGQPAHQRGRTSEAGE